MKEQFTPGPWHIERKYYIMADKSLVAEVYEHKSDVRLIVEAPEMFRLLQSMAGYGCRCPECQDTRELIARVLGNEVAG